MWKDKRTKNIKELYQKANLTRVIKAQRIQWMANTENGFYKSNCYSFI